MCYDKLERGSMKQLCDKDKEYYLQCNVLTVPFLDVEFIKEKVFTNINNNKKLGIEVSVIGSLMSWINHVVKYSSNKEIQELKFQRTSKEIFESGYASGCTDYAILFATFARQLGIPTTFLHTAEQDWIKRLKNNKDYKIHKGHSFCECYYDGKWILVDPTLKKITYNYNCDKIELDYVINGSNIFIPYYRDLDLSKRQTVKEHNEEMEDLCRIL